MFSYIFIYICCISSVYVCVWACTVCENESVVCKRAWIYYFKKKKIKKNLPYPILSPCSPAGPSAIFALFMDEFGIYLINPT